MKKIWQKIKDWSGWSTAGTIFKARLEMLGAVLTAGVTALASYSFLPFLTADAVNLTTVGIVAAYVGGSAMLTVIVRRWNAPDLKVK